MSCFGPGHNLCQFLSAQGIRSWDPARDLHKTIPENVVKMTDLQEQKNTHLYNYAKISALLFPVYFSSNLRSNL